MCRIIYGCITLDGEILSGSNGDDPAVDFSVETIERGLQINYKTPFSKMPSLTVTPNYGEIRTGYYQPSYESVGNFIVTSSERRKFRLELLSESNARKPENFSFIAIK